MFVYYFPLYRKENRINGIAPKSQNPAFAENTSSDAQLFLIRMTQKEKIVRK